VGDGREQLGDFISEKHKQLARASSGLIDRAQIHLSFEKNLSSHDLRQLVADALQRIQLYLNR
jgi:hypothetical protein